jgi:hypothetical protein
VIVTRPEKSVGGPYNMITFVLVDVSNVRRWRAQKAFLVGKISDVVDAETPGRQKIEFSAYALISRPDTPFSGAYPVQYFESLESIGIDPASLDWREVGPPAPTSNPIMRAKEMLSAAFGVPVEAIEIHIRA